MEAIDGTQPAEIFRVAVRLPPFWAERPVVWFSQPEVQFSLAGISSERTKFHCHISARPTIRRRGGGHRHLSSPTGFILQAEDRAAKTAAPLEGVARSPDSHAPGDGGSQEIAVSEAPQKPRP
jgi:hypothetical protein